MTIAMNNSHSGDRAPFAFVLEGTDDLYVFFLRGHLITLPVRGCSMRMVGGNLKTRLVLDLPMYPYRIYH